MRGPYGVKRGDSHKISQHPQRPFFHLLGLSTGLIKP